MFGQSGGGVAPSMSEKAGAGNHHQEEEKTARAVGEKGAGEGAGLAVRLHLDPVEHGGRERWWRGGGHLPER